MTPGQYAVALAALNLSQRSGAKFLGVNERTSRKWAAGGARIPESVAKLLRVMAQLKLRPSDIHAFTVSGYALENK